MILLLVVMASIASVCVLILLPFVFSRGLWALLMAMALVRDAVVMTVLTTKYFVWLVRRIRARRR